MKFVIQRVASAQVTVAQEVVGQIQHGYMVLIGIADSDTEQIADKMVQKLIALRLFEDAQGKTNLDLRAVSGSLQKRKSSVLYPGGRSGYGGGAVSIYHCGLQKGSACGGTGRFRRGYENNAAE